MKAVAPIFCSRLFNMSKIYHCVNKADQIAAKKNLIKMVDMYEVSGVHRQVFYRCLFRPVADQL